MNPFAHSFYSGERQSFHHLLAACLLLSFLLHLLLGLSLKKMNFISAVRMATPPARRVHLTFVDSPERIAPLEEEPEKTNLISNKSSRAQDMIPDREKDSPLPRAVGSARVKSIRLRTEGKPKSFRETAHRQVQEKPPQNKTPGAPEEESVRGRRAEPRAHPYPVEGRNKFSSPEADHPEGKADILKQVAYNVRSTAVGRYITRINPRIVNLWHLNIMKNSFFIRSKETSILFKIMPDGRLGRIKLNYHKGPEIEMRYTLNAIENAAPFPPLTKEVLDYIKEDGLWLTENFLYH